MQKIRSEPEPDEVIVVLVLVLKEDKVEEADGWCCRGGGATDNGADPDLPDEEKSCEERCLLPPFCDDDGEGTALMPLLVRADVAEAPDLFLFDGTVGVVVVVAVVAETKEPLMLLVLACCWCWWLTRKLCWLRSSSAKETFI